VDEMADALVRLAADASLRERLGSEGRRRFTEVFRHEHMTAQLRQLYQRLLQNRGAPRQRPDSFT